MPKYVARRLLVLTSILMTGILALPAQASVQRTPEQLGSLLLNEIAGFARLAEQPGKIGYLNRTQMAALLGSPESELDKGELIDGYLAVYGSSDGNGVGTVLAQFENATAAQATLDRNRAEAANNRRIRSIYETPQIPNSLGYSMVQDGLQGNGVMFRRANLLFDVGFAGASPSPEKALAVAVAQLNAVSAVPDEQPESGFNISYLIGIAVVWLLVLIAGAGLVVFLIRRNRKPAPKFSGYPQAQPFKPANGSPTTSFQPPAWEQQQPATTQPAEPQPVEPVHAVPAPVITAVPASIEVVDVGRSVVTYPDGWEGERE